MPGSIILYIFVLFFLYFIGLSMLGPRIVALQLLWQVVGGSVGRLRFWEVSPKERCEWLWIGSYPIISTYNHGKLWWEPAYWPWIIEFQGNIPLLIDRWNNQRPWITFGWMEGNAKLDLLATGVICWVYYGYFITFRSWGSLSCRNPHLARWQCFLVIFPTRVFFVQHARNKCICIYIYICMYVCIHIYIYIYTWKVMLPGWVGIVSERSQSLLVCFWNVRMYFLLRHWCIRLQNILCSTDRKGWSN